MARSTASARISSTRRVVPNIPLDGEGHIGMFRFENGHVDYKSRFVRTQRYKAQAAARESLFGTYRNPRGDDPRVKGLSRGTANTTPIFHHGKLFALKEDSPPVVLDPDTLETVDDYYTFGGKLKSLTFTAHPKIDSETGELIAFGYEASGEGSTDVAVLTISRGWPAHRRDLDQGALRRHDPRLRGHAETRRLPRHAHDRGRRRHEAGPHPLFVGLDACPPG